MDFFAQQDKARRQTRVLILLFVFASIAVVLAVDFVVLALAINFENSSGQAILPGAGSVDRFSGLLIITSVVTASLIAVTSLFRIATLSGGGGKVARSLGGTPVSPGTRDPLRRRLQNVVEEMAIASGVPVPEVYVLEQEPGLNAFAAGFSPSDAAIAVTRGSLETFSRNELQGVIAHEFSHILNGDMRLNMRLMGVLFGILVLSLIGRTILRSMRHVRVRSSRSNDKGGGMALVFVIGLALTVIGYIGLFLARLIKAGVSRQREYLADASAVQFTRQTQGIAGALKKIGFGATSVIQDADGEEISHMLFANGLRSFFNLYATHPPITERILALDPHFDPGTYRAGVIKQSIAQKIAAAEEEDADEPPAASQPRWHRLAEALLILTPGAVSESIGNPKDEHVAHASTLRRSIPEQIVRATQSERNAFLLVLSLLLSPREDIRNRQLERLSPALLPDQPPLLRQYHAELLKLGIAYRLPLLELAFPVLKLRPREQLEMMAELVDVLVHVDGRVDTFEYLLSRILLLQLRDAGNPSRAAQSGGIKLARCLQELHTLFSVVAWLGHQEGDSAARDAYQVGMLSLLPNATWPDYEPPSDWVAEMDKALEKLDRLPAVAKEELVKALTLTIAHDGKVTVSEAELLRAVCAVLHCPLPPFVLPADTGTE